MGKRKVLAVYGLLFVTMITFIFFQISQSQHIVGYMTFTSIEEEMIVSAPSELVLLLSEDLVLGENVGKNIEVIVSYTGKTPLRSCQIFPVPYSEITVYSSEKISLQSEEEIIVPVSIQTPLKLPSSRNFSLLFNCEEYSKEFSFSFSTVDDSSDSSKLTGFSVQDETKTKLSFFGFVVIGIIAVVFVARLFHRRDTRNYDFQNYPNSRRKYIPLDIS